MNDEERNPQHSHESDGPNVDRTRREWLRHAALACGVGAAAGLAGAQPSDLSAPDSSDPLFNVRRFGATGDGFADDTAAIQAAIDATLRARGGRIHFPSGRYRITRTLRVGSMERIDITGEGASTNLLHETPEHLLLWPENVPCREVSIRHLRIAAAGVIKHPEAAAIACFGGAERSFFSHLLFAVESGSMGSGIVVERVMDTTTLEHCLMWGPVSGTGVKIARGSEVRIFGGRILGSVNPYHGIDYQSIGVHLVGNNGGVHIVTTDLIGLHTALKIGSHGGGSNREIFITHATIDSSIHGIVQLDNTITSIAGCWAASCDQEQILLDHTAENAILTITGGTIFNGGAYGRPGAANGLVVRAGSFLLNAVAVRFNKGTGILVEGKRVGDYAITGCRITHNGTGVRLDGDSYIFMGNILARNSVALVDCGGCEKSIAGNVFNSKGGDWT